MQQNEKEKIKNRIVCIVVIAIISIILTFLSMDKIKNDPGVSFETKLDFLATACLVFVGWFLLIAFCIWFTRFLINSWKLKQNPSSLDAPAMIERKREDLKTATTLRKIIIGIMNVACIYFMIISSISAVVFFGYATSLGATMVFALTHILVILLVFANAVSDFVMMIKLKRSPGDEKAIKTREKGKKTFKTLIIIYLCLYALMFVYTIIFSRFK